MSLRGILSGFGLKVGATTRRTYAGRIRELIAGRPASHQTGPLLPSGPSGTKSHTTGLPFFSPEWPLLHSR